MIEQGIDYKKLTKQTVISKEHVIGQVYGREEKDSASQKPEIIVIGGSLVGPIVGMSLQKEGYLVTVFESDTQIRNRAGGVIGIRNESIPVLESVGISTDAISVSRRSSETTADYVYDIHNGEVNLRETKTFPGVNTTWKLLHEICASKIAIRYGKRVVNFVDGILHFEDGEKVSANVFIFADGKNSIGRKMLDPERRLLYQGYALWRGMTETSLQPAGYTHYNDRQRGVVFDVSEQITQGPDVGKVDWALYQPLKTNEYTALTNRLTDRGVHRVKYKMRDALYAYMSSLPEELQAIIRHTKDITLLPINDLAFPDRAVWQVGERYALLIGDALMCFRPQVARGLTAGIQQAGMLKENLIYQSDIDTGLKQWENRTLASLEPWITMGKQRAEEYYGMRSGL